MSPPCTGKTSSVGAFETHGGLLLAQIFSSNFWALSSLISLACRNMYHILATCVDEKVGTIESSPTKLVKDMHAYEIRTCRAAKWTKNNFSI